MRQYATAYIRELMHMHNSAAGTILSCFVQIQLVSVEIVQAFGAGQFYPGMPGGQFAPQHQRPAAQGYGPPAAGGYNSYAPPAAGRVNASHAFSATTDFMSYCVL